jgi:hypothetical protein
VVVTVVQVWAAGFVAANALGAYMNTEAANASAAGIAASLRIFMTFPPIIVVSD